MKNNRLRFLLFSPFPFKTFSIALKYLSKYADYKKEPGPSFQQNRKFYFILEFYEFLQNCELIR